MATGLLHGHQYLLLGMLVFATTFLYQVASTYYLQKKLISNTGVTHFAHPPFQPFIVI